jgi:phosphatidylserine decarboxylase
MIKIHKEGRKILTVSFLLLAAVNVTLFRFAEPLSLVPVAVLTASVLLYAFLLYFFRAPVRVADPDDTAVYSPADGKIVVIETATEKEYLKESRLQISVFMSPFNVHSNRYPVSGTVKDVIYHPGKYLVAWHPKSSELNERCTTVIEMESGEQIVVRQIAGALARRIVTYAKPGMRVRQGEELGFIKFGSRVDLFLPVGFKPSVSVDRKVKAVKSVLGRF